MIASGLILSWAELQAVLDNDQPIEETKGYGKAAKAIATMVTGHHRAIEERLAAIEQKKQEAETEKRRKEAERLAAIQKEKERQAAEAKRKKEAAARKKREAEEATRREADLFNDLMIPIKGATFQMGDEHRDLNENCRPVHDVTVKDFHLCKYPVTQAQWRKVMGEDPPELVFKGCDDCPVESVSWDDVQVFLKRLNEQTDGNYRLPVEAEWEFAARGGTKSKSFKYAGSNEIKEVGWYNENADGKTHRVGKKKANELGLFDMSGNVWEWCEDEWKSYPNSKKSFHDKSIRVVRGGSWFSDNRNCRVADRRRDNSSNRNGGIGFRLARY